MSVKTEAETVEKINQAKSMIQKKTKVELFISDEQNSWQKTKGIQKTTPFKRGRKI